jgi:hypothetical protein
MEIGFEKQIGEKANTDVYNLLYLQMPKSTLCS